MIHVKPLGQSRFRQPLMALWLFLAVMSAHGQAVADDSADPFPRPAALAPAIDFWMRIYSEFDVASGLVHDSRDLAICYTPLYLNRGAPLVSQNRAIEEAIAHYRSALLALAEGKRADLNAFEQRALEPWRRRGGRPEELRAAAERIRFQRGQEDRFRAGLERARRWEHQIKGIFRQQGLPTGLAALPHVESSYNAQAISKVGAAGLWQFMPATARRYIRVDDEVDERFDVIKSTHAAANLLQHNYSVLKRWPLALTAYNHGLSGVRRAVQTLGSDDIVEIIEKYEGNRFGFASRNFYVAFVAAHDLAQDPKHYFKLLDPAVAIELTAPAYLPAPQLAEFFGVSLHDLRAVNPRMHHDVWNGKHLIARGSRFRLPRSVSSARLNKRLARFSAEFGFDGPLPVRHYDLSYGESLSGIAAGLSTSVQRLVEMNGLDDAHQVKTGQRLRVPTPEVPRPLGRAAARLLPELLSFATPQEDTLSIAAEARQRAPEPTSATEAFSVDSPEAEQLAAAPLAEAQPDLAADPADYSVAADGTIEIQAAETLGHYAQWLKIPSDRLTALNDLGEAKPLIVGRRLTLDFDRTSPQAFEQARTAFHRNRQLAYFAEFRITGVAEHRIRSGQSLWDIAMERYRIPLWLLRQYNPDVDTDTLLRLDRPLYVPLVESRPPSARETEESS